MRGYVVVSVVALVARGQWLVRVGPVHVSEGVSDLEMENAMLRAEVAISTAVTEHFREELKGFSEVLDKASGSMEMPGTGNEESA